VVFLLSSRNSRLLVLKRPEGILLTAWLVHAFYWFGFVFFGTILAQFLLNDPYQRTQLKLIYKFLTHLFIFLFNLSEFQLFSAI
jgi:hypothetical protein